MTTPLRVLTGANAASTKVTFRPRSPAGSPRGGNGGSSTRRIRGGQEGRQHRLQQRVRSKSPTADSSGLSTFALSTTPVALDKNKEAPRTAAGGSLATTPDIDEADAMSPRADTKKQANKAPALLAAVMPESVTKDPTSSELKKIRCVPVKGEGTAFDDFWSSGWG